VRSGRLRSARGRGAEQPGQAVEQDIGRLQVTVDHAGAVGNVQRCGMYGTIIVEP
jgi:hypothetical protein